MVETNSGAHDSGRRPEFIGEAVSPDGVMWHARIVESQATGGLRLEHFFRRPRDLGYSGASFSIGRTAPEQPAVTVDFYADGERKNRIEFLLGWTWMPVRAAHIQNTDGGTVPARVLVSSEHPTLAVIVVRCEVDQEVAQLRCFDERGSVVADLSLADLQDDRRFMRDTLS